MAQSRRGRIPIRRRPIPRPVAQQNDKAISYVMNDMTTPNLIKVIPQPQPPAEPKFVVRGYQGGGFQRGSIQNLAADCFVTIVHTLDYYRKFFERPMNRWAAVPVLAVNPIAGKDLNAFYDRRSLQFFMFSHPQIGEVFTAESSDIVAHELGHAIFDTYRPDTWGAASLEVWSYHEAFADLTAILHIMQYDEVLQHAINKTNGNLRGPNVIARLAEHVGRSVFAFTGPKSGRNQWCLRNANNKFNYVPPNKLPKEATHDKLAAECHSFGRIFLGAFYDILVEIYEAEKQNRPPMEALKVARDALAARALVASQHAGLNVRYYESVAKTMLWVDKTKHDGKYQEILKKVFINRNLVRPQLLMLNAPKCDNENNIMKTEGKLSLRLSDHVIRAQSISNPLYDVELEIPHEQMYLYDEGNPMDAVLVSQQEAISAAQDMVDYLYATNSVSDDPSTPFEIRNGKLVRTHFS